MLPRAVDGAIRRQRRADAREQRDRGDVGHRPRAPVFSCFVAEIPACRLVDSYAHREPDAGSDQDVARAPGTSPDLHAIYACALNLHHTFPGFE